MAELTVQDSEFVDASNQYYSKAQKIEECMSKYVGILQSIVGEKILEGDASLALADFTSLAEGYMCGELEAILQRHKTKVNAFVSDTETDDEAQLS